MASSAPTDVAARFTELREDAVDRERAHQLAAESAVRSLQVVRAHLEARNYGSADDELDALLKLLPHDFGAQTFYPLFDDKLELARAARKRRSS